MGQDLAVFELWVGKQINPLTAQSEDVLWVIQRPGGQRNFESTKEGIVCIHSY